MSVALEVDTVRLFGECGVEDAEELLAVLAGASGITVDLSAAGHLHSAVFQVLLRLRPRLVGCPQEPFFALWLLPLL
jgi:hypothetical protein